MKLSDALFSPVREHRSRSPTGRTNTAVVATAMPSYGISGALSQTSAQKLSAVYAAIEIRSDPAGAAQAAGTERPVHWQCV